MKKRILLVIDIAIFILCFLFLLSSFFKMLSLTYIESLVYVDEKVLVGVWIAGILIAGMFTHPLAQWILHWRK